MAVVVVTMVSAVTQAGAELMAVSAVGMRLVMVVVGMQLGDTMLVVEEFAGMTQLVVVGSRRGPVAMRAWVEVWLAVHSAAPTELVLEVNQNITPTDNLQHCDLALCAAAQRWTGA